MNNIVFEDKNPMRLDAFLAKLANISRARAKENIEQAHCSLDNKICLNPAQKIKFGQEFSWELAEVSNELKAEQAKLDLVYADEYLVVVNKPADLTVHPCPSCPNNTLVQQVLSYFPELKKISGLRPGIVHRLDKDTSGLIVIALNEEVRQQLSADFANRAVEKTYLAIVDGKLENTGDITYPIGRDPKSKIKMAVVPENKGGREAFTSYTRLYTSPNDEFSLVKVKIHTGRTHQIRVHFSAINHPLLGDKVYNKNKFSSQKAERQMLHSYQLSFTHPITKEKLSFTKKPPQDFFACLANFKYPCQKVIVVGQIGSGKSSLLNLFKNDKYPIFSADLEVQKLYEPNNDGWILLDKFFSSQFTLDKNQPVDKVKLFLAMQSDPNLTKEIEKIIHPLVFYKLNQFWLENQSADLAIAEIPLFFETKQSPDDYFVIHIVADSDIRFMRIKNRSWSYEKFTSLEAKLLPEKYKSKLANYVLDNSNSEAELKLEYQKIIALLQANIQKAYQEVQDIYAKL